MQLVNNWKNVLRKAWSIRLLVLAGVLTGVETVVLPLLDIYVPPALSGVISFLVIMGAFVARLVAQKSIHEENEE